MPGVASEHDFALVLLGPLLDRLVDGLGRVGLPAALRRAALELVAAVLMVTVAGAALGSAARLRRAGHSSRLVAALAGLLGMPALAWILIHPASAFHELFLRVDHLVFAVLVGTAVRALPGGARRWVVAAVSILLVGRHCGARALCAVMGVGLLGLLALLPPWGRRPRAAVGIQGGLLLVAYAAAWRLRASDGLGALELQGLLFFVYLRHLSFVVEVCRGSTITLGDYLCYLTFYPGLSGAFGAPETYPEFSRRNLGPRLHPDDRLAFRQVALGLTQVWIARRIPASTAALVEASTMAAAWGASLSMLLRVALYGMGIWALIDATALAFGFRLRANFSRILQCENPSDLWRAWRGSMTNWLITYVYAPLGANRHRQVRNILAAFTVSLVWHLAGIPFLAGHPHPAAFAAMGLWAALNAAGVAGHVMWRRAGAPTLWPAVMPASGRRLARLAGTAVLTSFSATLPGFQTDLAPQLGRYLRHLLGIV